MMGKSLNYAYPRKFAEGGEVPSGVEVPEGFEFAGMVDSKYKGPVASFTKQGDDTGFTVYAATIDYGNNEGKTGYFFDDIGDEAGSAGTGGYLDANDAFNQGRTRSDNYVFHYNTMIDRGVELDDAAMEQLNAALAHHDKYLGGDSAFDRRRDNLIDTMNAVQGYENYGGAAYTIGDEGARLQSRTDIANEAGSGPSQIEVPSDTIEPFRREGVEYVEHNGKMVPKEAVDALKMTVGLIDEDLRYDINGDGQISSNDAIGFLRYGALEDYGSDTDFFTDFYGTGTAAPEPEQKPFDPGQLTTMAMGEEDTFTTQAMGEEDGGLPINEATTMAVGEEDGGGGIPKDAFDPVVTTMAMGEEDDGGGMIMPIQPPADQLDPVPAPRPENPFLDLIPPAEVDPVTPITPAPRPENPFLGLPVPFEPPVAELPVNPPVMPPIATTTAFGEEDGGMPPPVEQPRTYGEIPPTIQPVGRTYGNTNPMTGETVFNQMYKPVAVDATQALDPLREGLGTFLPGGAGNYANNPFMRPVGYSEGGSVKMTDINNGKNEQLGNDMVLLEFADGTKRMTQKALYEAAESLGAFDNMTNEKDFADWHLNTWASGVVNDPQYKAAHNTFNSNQISYNNALMESNPQIAQNRLAFVQQHAPNNTAALEAAQALVDQYSGVSGMDAMQQDTVNLSQRDTALNNGITAGTMGLISSNQPVQEEVETPTTISPFGDYMGYATGFDRGQGAGGGGGFYEVPTIFGSGLTTSADVATQDLNLLNRNPFRRPT